MNIKISEKGSSLVECLVALLLLTIAVGFLSKSQQVALRFAKLSEVESSKFQSSKSALARYLAEAEAAEKRKIFSIDGSKILGSIECQPLFSDSKEEIVTKCDVSFSDDPTKEVHLVQ